MISGVAPGICANDPVEKAARNAGTDDKGSPALTNVGTTCGDVIWSVMRRHSFSAHGFLLVQIALTHLCFYRVLQLVL